MGHRGQLFCVLRVTKSKAIEKRVKNRQDPGSQVLLSLTEGELPGQTSWDRWRLWLLRNLCPHHTLPAANVISLENHTEWVLNKLSSTELNSSNHSVVSTMYFLFLITIPIHDGCLLPKCNHSEVYWVKVRVAFLCLLLSLSSPQETVKLWCLSLHLHAC